MRGTTPYGEPAGGTSAYAGWRGRLPAGPQVFSMFHVEHVRGERGCFT
jgi:hypothetical protein